MTVILNELADSIEPDSHDLPVPASFHREGFPYGWRRVTETLRDGTVIFHDIPLDPEDFLNPELGDQMPQGPQHAEQAVRIYNKLRKHCRRDPHTAVLFDCKMKWGIPGLNEPFPDIAVIPGVRDRDNIRGSFYVAEQGTRPALIIEIMSPGYAGDDTAKVGIYERAGIREYIILNPHFEDESLPFELTGYRLVRGRYQKMIPDPDGRLLSRSIGVRFAPGAGGREVVLTNAVTGEEMLSDEEEYQARQNAETRAENAEARAEKEAQARQNAEAELQRLRAELARFRDEK